MKKLKNITFIKMLLCVEFNLGTREYESYTTEQWLQLYDGWLELQEKIEKNQIPDINLRYSGVINS